MKKILMVTLSRHASFQDGVFSMYHQLKKRYQIWTITRSNNDYPAPHEEHNNFIEAPENPGISKETFNFHECKRMMGIIHKINPDIIYIESFHLWNYPIMFYCKANNKTLACSLNDVIIHEGDSHIQIKRLFNFSQVWLADRVIMRSANGYENARKMYSRYSSKMFTVGLWYTFPKYCPPSGKDILFFGRMNRYKGIDALYQVIKATPEFHYVVAGNADSDSDLDTVDKIALLPNVELENRVIPYDDMHDYFYSARCVILPYKSATQSGVILDASKHSRPAIAFKVGALGEQIIDGETGYLVEPENIDQLIKKVKDLMEMPDNKYERMCEAAYAFGFERFSAKGQEKNFLKALGIY